MLIDTIQSDIKTAMLERDSLTVNVLKGLKTSLVNEKIAKGEDLTEVEETAVVKREFKKRKEAIQIYSGAGQTEKAEAEQAECVILEKYMPEQMSQEQLANEVQQAIEKLGATAPSDTGKVMGYLAKKLAGRVDNKQMADMVKTHLAGTQ